MTNPLPIFNAGDQRYVELPLHAMNVELRECVYCTETSVYPTYEAYVQNFWKEEFEGDYANHAPMTEHEFTMIYSLCPAVAA